MAGPFKVGDCVRIPDGRTGRVREVEGRRYKVRVRRKTSQTHQFLTFAAEDLERVDCPEGVDEPGGGRPLPRRHAGQDAPAGGGKGRLPKSERG